jgi:hypothetical protein
LHENVLAFFTRFFCPGFLAQTPVFGMVSLPSVDVTDDDFFFFLSKMIKTSATKVSFSFCDLFCQIIFVDYM